MKKCSYCGKEYPDDATTCVIDTQPLIDPHAPKELQLQEEEKEEKQAIEPKSKEPYLLWPDYQWCTKDAWKCIGILFCLNIVLGIVFHLGHLILPHFYRSGFGFVSRSLLHYSVELLAAAYFARTETFAAFWKGFGLDRQPTDLVWFGMAMALIIRFAGHFMRVHGWGRGVYNYDVHEFQNTVGLERYLFLVPLVVLPPLFEEPIYRGFLYKAFRGSYPIIFSMFLIVAWTCFTHWAQYSHSWIAAVDLSALTIVQCYLREKSPSLWDCILCHAVFNASTFLV